MKNTFSGHCWNSNTMLCPHLGRNYPRGNKYKGKIISQENAASLDKFWARRRTTKNSNMGVQV